jgi:hypothetical protein
VVVEEEDTAGGPAQLTQSPILIIQIDSNLNWSKDGVLLLENFQIKYGHVDIEIRNKFPQ